MPRTRSHWRRHVHPLIPLLAVTVLLPAPAVGQPSQPATQPVTDPDPTRAIGLLRAELVDSFNKGEVDRLLSYLDPDVVVTWQNGEVCRGPQAVRAFYERMMVGPDRVVRRISCNPKPARRVVRCLF